MRRRRSLTTALLLFGALTAPACIPYTVGTTAQTVPIGERHRSVSATVLPRGGEEFGDSSRTPSFSYLSFDGETRVPLSERSDLGLRVPSASGVIVNYKRRHTGYPHPDSAAFAMMWGGGIINMGLHGHLEATMLRSGRRRGAATSYGGVRLMQAFPLSARARSDDPTLGAFFGVALGNLDFAVLPEIAVYYDRSVLGIRATPWMFIPSVTLRNIPFPSLGGIGRGPLPPR